MQKNDKKSSALIPSGISFLLNQQKFGFFFRLSQLQIKTFQLRKFSDQSQSAARHLRTSVEVQRFESTGVFGQRQQTLVRDCNALTDVQDFQIGQSLGQPLETVVADGACGQG